jgi:hypothetical protein
VRRFLIVVALAGALSSFALAVGVSQARAGCSSNNGFVTCQYWNASAPTYCCNSCCVSWYAYSPSGYWYTDKMWRPVNNWASVYWVNSAGVHGNVTNYGTNPFWTKGSWGYDVAYCENDSGHSLSSVTCQVYNWDA